MFQAAMEKIKPKKTHTELLNEAIETLQIRDTSQVYIKKINFEKTKQFNIFLEALIQCPTLESLHIENCVFNEEIFKKLTETLTQCVTLSWIFLSFNNLSEANIKLIAENFEKFRSLACLNLSGNLISEETASLLCGNIPTCPTLTTLIFDGKFIDIHKQITNNLNENKILIKKFHTAVKNLENSDYKDIFKRYPTLCDSYDEKNPVLHGLIDQKYSNKLIEFLKTNPSPYHTDIVYSKTAFRVVKDTDVEIKNILQKYMDSYPEYYQYQLNENRKFEKNAETHIIKNNISENRMSSKPILPDTVKTHHAKSKKILRRNSMKLIVSNVKREEQMPEKKFLEEKNTKKIIPITEEISQITSQITFFTPSNYNNTTNVVGNLARTISAPDSARSSQTSPSSASHQSPTEEKQDVISEEPTRILLSNNKI